MHFSACMFIAKITAFCFGLGDEEYDIKIQKHSDKQIFYIRKSVYIYVCYGHLSTTNQLWQLIS